MPRTPALSRPAADPKPDYIYMGLRENMIAEVAAFDPTEIGVSKRECKYLVQPIGEAQWDTQWFPSRKEANAEAKCLADAYAVKICRVS